MVVVVVGYEFPRQRGKKKKEKLIKLKTRRSPRI